jgi:uncharacterized protein (TIGR01777 family)
MPEKILLTGGSGLLGNELTRLLLDKGYEVCHLSRKPGKNPDVKTYLWDINRDIIDEKCLEGVNTIIHLAGAGIADKRWTTARKKELIDSRTKSINLIYSILKKNSHQIKSVISAAATGYYSDRSDELLTEDSLPSHDFLANCCIQWEQAVDNGTGLGLRVLKFRTGVVLTEKGGALPKLAFPVKVGIGSPLANGKQWVPWIHHKDVVDMYLYGITNTNLQGAYNMVAPNPVTNKQLTKAVARQLHRPLWMPNIPAFVLKLLLGEMSTVVLGSSKVSASKIENAGFIFKYPVIEAALADIYNR